jgi:protein TonB
MSSKGQALLQPFPMDNPWHRLPWTLPIALFVWLMGLWAMGVYLERPAQYPSETKPIEAQFLELPPPATIQVPPAKHSRPRPKSPPPPEPMPLPAEPTQPLPKVIPEPETPQTETHPAVPQAQQVPPAPTMSAPPATPLPGAGQGARAIYQPKPKIPEDLREDALNAVAVARFHIAADGTASVELITPTANPRLNQVLLNTLKTWRFFPAMKNGIPVASTQDLRISVEVK